jgi:hypothetical protein
LPKQSQFMHRIILAHLVGLTRGLKLRRAFPLGSPQSIAVSAANGELCGALRQSRFFPLGSPQSIAVSAANGELCGAFCGAFCGAPR